MGLKALRSQISGISVIWGPYRNVDLFSQFSANRTVEERVKLLKYGIFGDTVISGL